MVDRKRIHEREPHVIALAALEVPSTGIVSAAALLLLVLAAFVAIVAALSVSDTGCGINPENLRGRLEKIRSRQIAEARDRASRN